MDEGYSGIIIRQDMAIRRVWTPPVFDDETDDVIEDGFYSEIEVTDKLLYHFRDNCIIEDGTTLRDFFKILKKNYTFFSIVFYSDYFKEWLDTGLNSPISDLSRVRDYSSFDFDYLELSKSISINRGHIFQKDNIMKYTVLSKNGPVKFRHKIHSVGDVVNSKIESYNEFHGISYPLTYEYIEKHKKEGNIYKVGERIPIGFLGSEIATYIDCPLKIKQTIDLTTISYDENDKINYQTEKILNTSYFTFFEIADTILNELSFYGSPTDSKKEWEEICKQKYNIMKNL